MPSLVEKLFKSRRWYPNNTRDNRYEYHSDVADLVRQIEEGCAKVGLQLVRYANNSYPYGFYNPLIHWAILPAKMPRPAQSRLLPSSAFIVELRGIEGTTKRCRAYRALSALWEDLDRTILPITR